MRDTTACPLDCYDACRIIVDDHGRIKGDPTHPVTQGYLCQNLNHYDEYPRLTFPSYQGQQVTLDEAIDRLAFILKSDDPKKILFYRGSGNLGLMQRSMDHFFAGIGAVGTSGSLCDGAGEAGILQGRGVNYSLSVQMIEQCESVVIWGKNPEVTHSHLLPILKKKRLIVIDPVKTGLAKGADIHLQIKPKCDLHLALAVCGLLIDLGYEKHEFITEFTKGYGHFRELLQTISIEDILQQIDLSMDQVMQMIEMISHSKTIILVGVGVQKYHNGAQVLRAIDAIGAILGLFGKEGSGVSYLGTSVQGLDLPFQKISNNVPVPAIDFSQFKTVFIQGGNPIAQLPDSNRVIETFSTVSEKIYFGTYANETSQMCDLIIPSKSFLEKEDVRASYGDYTLQRMNPLRHSTSGVAEYDLAKALCDHFEIAIPTKNESLSMLHKQIEIVDGVEYKQNRPIVPYQKGFETVSGKFEFMDDIDLEVVDDDDFFFITAKASKSLNSQFKRPEGIHLHSQCGFEPDEEVNVSSSSGSLRLRVIHDDRLRPDCVLIHSGTPGVNVLTSSQMSDHGNSAIYQENKVKVERC